MSPIIERIDPHIRYTYECDDRSGFKLVIINSCDGDIWLKILPTEYCKHPDLFAGCFGAGVRIRMPVTGGGSHDNLWDGLAKALRKEDEDFPYPLAPPPPPSPRVVREDIPGQIPPKPEI